MDPQLSEFSYGYCLTEELMSDPNHRLRGAPIFPTQRQEGQIGGFDVAIPRNGLPLFMQFKLCHYLQQSNALEWDLHGGPYYRMFIRRRDRSNQQMLMVRWEAAGHETYYAAPLFHTHRELSEAYDSGQTIASSAFFSPGEIGLLTDNKKHYLTFVPGARYAYFHSKEPKPITPPLVGLEIFEKLEEGFEERRREFSLGFFSELIQDLRDLSQFVDEPLLVEGLFDRDLPDRDDPIETAAIQSSIIAWHLFDSYLILLHRGE